MRLWTRRESSLAGIRDTLPGISATTDAAEAARGAEMVVFCTPIGAMAPLAEAIQPHVSAKAAVTDGGSVKGSVVAAMEGIWGGRFVGSHPMAGSEKSGLQAARGDLFEGAACVLTPTPATDAEALAMVRRLWQSVGARTLEMPPAVHDRLVARASHLPHAVAAALVKTICAHAPETLEVAAGGYRDTTRIAAGPAALWREILLENRVEIIAGLEEFMATLQTLKHHLSSADAGALENFLAEARAARAKTP